MARAWEQAGAVNDANALLRRSQLARELGNVVMERHLAPLRPPDLLAMTQPAHAQIQLAERDRRRASCGQAGCPRPWCRARCAGSPARRA